MMSILSGFLEDIMEVFMDDFSVYGSGVEICFSNSERVLKRFVKATLLKWGK